MKSKEEIQKIKKEYPPGTVIELIKMNDPCPVPDSTLAEVTSVDDAGQLHVEYMGLKSNLAIIPGKDEIKKLTTPPFKRCRYCQHLCFRCTFECELTGEEVDLDNGSCEDFEVMWND